MKYLVLPLLCLLAACGSKVNTVSAEPIIVPTEVAVPIAGACVPDALGPVPTYVDSKEALSAAGPVGDPDAAAKRYQLVVAGRIQRDARLNEIEPIVAGCPRGKVEKK